LNSLTSSLLSASTLWGVKKNGINWESLKPFYLIIYSFFCCIFLLSWFIKSKIKKKQKISKEKKSEERVSDPISKFHYWFLRIILKGNVLLHAKESNDMINKLA
jgi:preprotein translocase subunit SecG